MTGKDLVKYLTAEYHTIYFILIRIETIVVYLILQSTPTYANEVAGYSAVEYLMRSFPVIPFNRSYFHEELEQI